MPYCPKCGERVSGSDVFCSRCGARLGTEPGDLERAAVKTPEAKDTAARVVSAKIPEEETKGLLTYVEKDKQTGRTEQKLRLLLDKLHGEDLDTYNKLAGFLSGRCQVSILKKKPLDLKLLTENDVFMPISPNKPWEESEVQNVQRYIETHGGILVAIAQDGRKPERLNKLLEPYGLSVIRGTVNEKHLDKNNLEGSQLLEGIYSLALGAVWGYGSAKIAASNESEVVMQYKDAILGANRSLGRGTVYLFSCLPAFGNKQLEQADNRIFLDNLLKSVTMPTMTGTLRAIAKDEALVAQATVRDEALAAQKIEGYIITGHSEDLFFTSDRLIVAKLFGVPSFSRWGFGSYMADAFFKGVKAGDLSKLRPDEILKSDKRNFCISYDEIGRFEIRKKAFPFGAWEITVETTSNKHTFEWGLGAGRDVRKNTSFLVPLLSDKLSILD